MRKVMVIREDEFLTEDDMRSLDGSEPLPHVEPLEYDTNVVYGIQRIGCYHAD